MSKELAVHGGEKTIKLPWQHLIKWPVITEEDETAVLDALRSGDMSGTAVTRQFEQDMCAYLGVSHCLGHCNGTAALMSAMYACGVGVGDEIICPSMTYWASALPCYSLGATVVFADVMPETLCIDPSDIVHRITPKTKAIVVVHYAGYPCDMDAILAIAKDHGVYVIEDVSHAQGSLYKGRMTGALGHISAMSLMAQKSLVAGEGGMLATSDTRLLERAIAFGHYERHGELTEPDLVEVKGYPLGGVKYRLNQLASALGRTQLKHYAARITEIQKAMNHFWDLLEGCPGIRAHRPPRDSGSTMGGWYAAKGLYRSDELGGLPIGRFCEAVTAEGSPTHAGGNAPIHLHPLFNTCDIYGHGKPTRMAHTERDLRQAPGSLPASENVANTVFSIPHFKHFDADVIAEHAAAFRKVAGNAESLLEREAAAKN